MSSACLDSHLKFRDDVYGSELFLCHSGVCTARIKSICPHRLFCGAYPRLWSRISDESCRDEHLHSLFLLEGILLFVMEGGYKEQSNLKKSLKLHNVWGKKRKCGLKGEESKACYWADFWKVTRCYHKQDVIQRRFLFHLRILLTHLFSFCLNECFNDFMLPRVSRFTACCNHLAFGPRGWGALQK